MIVHKLLICLLISLVLTNSQPLPDKLEGYLKNAYESFQNLYNTVSGQSKSSKFIPAERLSQSQSQLSIFSEAVQEHCPFPGFKGSYCPTEYSSKTEVHSDQQIPYMPKGVGFSYDVTTGELKIPALELTYPQNPSQDQIWTDPHSNKKFILAKEMGITSVELNPEVRLFKDEQELAETFFEAQKQGDLLGGLYSQPKDILELHAKYFGGGILHQAISQKPKNVLMMRYKSNKFQLNSFAQRAIDSLPEEYNKTIYNEFLNIWGTHVSFEVYIGGMIEKQTKLKQCAYSKAFTNTMEEDEIISALYDELDGRQVNDYFTGRRRVIVDHKLGGDQKAESNWEQTISQNPAVLKITKGFLWQTFPSSRRVSENLDRATKNRMEVAQLRYNSYKSLLEDKIRAEQSVGQTAFQIVNHQVNKGYYVDRFWMAPAEMCPPGQSFYSTMRGCRSRALFSLIAGDNERTAYRESIRYERDDQGRFRALFNNGYMKEEKDGREFYGEWVKQGCSIAQHDKFYNIKLSDAPYKNSFPRTICTSHCIPTQSRDYKFECNCTAFFSDD